MSQILRWGILSTANIGRARVIPAINQSRNGTVVAVASRDHDRAAQFADEMSIPTAYGSYEELLEDPDIDAIYNPLPNSMHAEWAIKAAEAGKPMLCEKPLALNADEAQRMVDAFKERNLTFAEGFMYRFHPQTQRVKQAVDSGEIGELHTINAHFSFTVRDAGNIRLSAGLGGGSLMDVGCYCINVTRFMTGQEPIDVRGMIYTGRSLVDIRAAGLLRFPDGVLGHFVGSLNSFRTHTYTLVGTKGTITVPEAFVPAPGASTSFSMQTADGYDEYTVERADHYELMVEDFADAVILDRPPMFPPEDAVANMRVIDQFKAVATR
ncbi:MAG: Gfo/Idh/MocA family protein [Chloroflexota bacterium]